jgi:hypothetical protein
MGTRLAVLFIHGVEINDKDFAETASGLLRKAFVRHTGGAAREDDLIIRTAFWAPLLQAGEDRLMTRVGGTPLSGFFRKLTRLGTKADAGSALSLLSLAASGLLRKLPWAPDFHYPALRWVAVHYLGDAIAYQINSSERVLYDEIHAVVAKTLGELAKAAGEDAPLCVIAHSLGSVVASNFFYDLQAEYGRDRSRKHLVETLTEAALGPTPLERGETLSFLYTLGSPIALWAGRLPDFGQPLVVPDPCAKQHHPEIAGEWVNIHDPDDVISWPLKGLNAAYDRQVTEDRAVSVGPWWIGWTPLAHMGYWNDRNVMDPIGRTLSQVWRTLSGSTKDNAEEAGADARAL